MIFELLTQSQCLRHRLTQLSDEDLDFVRVNMNKTKLQWCIQDFNITGAEC